MRYLKEHNGKIPRREYLKAMFLTIIPVFALEEIRMYRTYSTTQMPSEHDAIY
jgi:hypothetical protein